MNLYLASLENDYVTIETMIDVKPLFVLGSFYYLQKLKPEILERYFSYINSKDCKGFILDSGAFSMLNAKGGKESFLENLDNYIEDYIKFIKFWNIKNFIELDIDPLVGYSKVLEIREKIEKEVGRKSVPVWHVSRGTEEWEKMIKGYEYVAIGGIVTKEIKKKDYKKIFLPMLKMARDEKCDVHGLGFTGKQINDFPFFSCDSSSWSSIKRFGSMPIFSITEKCIKNRSISENKKIKSGNEARIKLMRYSIREWKKFQVFLYKGEI